MCKPIYWTDVKTRDLGRWPYSLSSFCTILTNNYCDSKRQSKCHDRTATATSNTKFWTNSGRGSTSTETGGVPVSVKRPAVPCSVYVTRMDRVSRWHAPTSIAATCQHFTCVVSTCSSSQATVYDGDWCCSSECQETDSSMFCVCNKNGQGEQVTCTNVNCCNVSTFHLHCVNRQQQPGRLLYTLRRNSNVVYAYVKIRCQSSLF